MNVFLTILIVFACVLVVCLVLVQNSKGGGLAAGFTSGNQVMGAPKTADFLEKATWTLIAIVILLSVFAVGLGKSTVSNDSDSQISEQVQEAASELQQQAATPAFDDAEPAEE